MQSNDGDIVLMADIFEQTRLEQFCAQFAFGVPVPVALKAAGYDVTSVSFGYSLLKDPKAMGLVDSHREWIKSKLSSSLETVLQQLDRDREFAYELENPAAAVSATMHKAKLLGYVDTVNKGVPAKITIEWASGDVLEAQPS